MQIVRNTAKVTKNGMNYRNLNLSFFGVYVFLTPEFLQKPQKFSSVRKNTLDKRISHFELIEFLLFIYTQRGLDCEKRNWNKIDKITLFLESVLQQV